MVKILVSNPDKVKNFCSLGKTLSQRILMYNIKPLVVTIQNYSQGRLKFLMDDRITGKKNKDPYLQPWKHRNGV
jgi:hypothetical protein